MNFESNSIQLASRFLKSHNFVTNLDGQLFKILPPFDYKIKILKLISLMMIGFVTHIIKKYPYHPITIMGNTIYCHVTSSCLSRHNIPHILSKGNNRIPYYETEDGNEIPFEGPTRKYFLDSTSNENEIVPVIPLSTEELTKLQLHTKLSNLESIQKKILDTFIIKDTVHVPTIKHLINESSDCQKLAGPILNIKRFFGGLYYVTTPNEIWISKLIITDNVIPLQPGEIISGLSGIVTSQSSDKYLIEHTSQSCIIYQPDIRTKLTRHYNYQVNPDLSITSLSNHSNEEHQTSRESILYNLRQPRPFTCNSICTIHPFHLPSNWDPFLTIMIVCMALVAELNNK